MDKLSNTALEGRLSSFFIPYSQLSQAKQLVRDAYQEYGIEPGLNLKRLKQNLFDYYSCLKEFSRMMC